MLLRGVVFAAGQGDPGQQQFAADGGKPPGQLSRRAQVPEGQAQQRLLLIGPGQQRRAGPLGEDLPCRLDGGQRLAGLESAGIFPAYSSRSRQNARISDLEQQAPAPAPAATPAASSPMIDQLNQLAELHQQGVLTDEEFAAAKAKLFGS